MSLFYVPLESYEERYTAQLSRAETGWLEAKWKKYGVEYTRINGEMHEHGDLPNKITTGVVLDVQTRTRWAFRQVETILHLMETGDITGRDTIYFDDFWHPGIEQVRYMMDQLQVYPDLCSFLWAQSVDKYDFTYRSKPWMRPIEQGIGAMMDKIFVANTELKDLVRESGIARPGKTTVYVVGLPFDSVEVASNFVKSPVERTDKVVFSSRFDSEKNPDFMMEVAAKVIKRCKNAQFVVCTSAKELRSNSNHPLNMAAQMQDAYPNNFIVKTGLTKKQYYHELQSAKIQFNCADQDWVSYTLLEAVTAGAVPIYPVFRSFVETMHGTVPMYRHKDAETAVQLICDTLNKRNMWNPDPIAHRWGSIAGSHDYTWLRMLECMGIEHKVPMEEMEASVGDSWIMPYNDTFRKSLVNQRKAVK